MQKIAYFGHDVSDAAVRRRIAALKQDGLDVLGFTKRRADASDPEWINIDLGQTHDGAFLQRVLSVFSGAFRAWRERDKLQDADVIIARNLDMLASALMANRFSNAKLPVIYECLDVHRLMCRDDFIGGTLRRLEGWMMSKTRGLILSSPAFLSEYFEKYHGPQKRVKLVENRIVQGLVTRPPSNAETVSAMNMSGPLRLGWVGILRCHRSLDIICSLAERFPQRLAIELHGIPAHTEVPDFEQRIAGHKNIAFHGRYKSPEDLEKIYNSLDVVWSIDFMEAGQNSVWLLPNRIYEGGLFSVPSVALEGTQTARWLSDKGVGLIVQEPLKETAAQLLTDLFEDRQAVHDKQAAFSKLADETFIEPAGFIRAAIEELLSSP